MNHWKIICDLSGITGEAIGVLKGLSWHNEEITVELRDEIDKAVARLEAKCQAVQEQMTEGANKP